MNRLARLCKKEGWTREDVSNLLPNHPKIETIRRWQYDSHPANITDNDFLLLQYIAKYGRL